MRFRNKQVSKKFSFCTPAVYKKRDYSYDSSLNMSHYYSVNPPMAQNSLTIPQHPLVLQVIGQRTPLQPEYTWLDQATSRNVIQQALAHCPAYPPIGTLVQNTIQKVVFQLCGLDIPTECTTLNDLDATEFLLYLDRFIQKTASEKMES